MELITVIVPAYNAGDTIEKCLYSILTQSYKNIEIIVINDGSQDSTLKKLEHLRKKYKHIKVYTKVNGGLSSARNFGLIKSKGEYISFIDSDDFIDEKMIERLYIKIKEFDCDVVISGFKILKNNKVSYKHDPFLEEKLFNREEKVMFLKRFLSRVDGEEVITKIPNSVCSCLYKNKIIKQKKIYFNELVRVGQDKIFNLKYFLNCDSILVIPEKFYYYNRETIFNGTQSESFSNNQYDNFKLRNNLIKKLLKKHDFFKKVEHNFIFSELEGVMACLENITHKNNRAVSKNKVDQIKCILKETNFLGKLSLFNVSQLKILEYKKIIILKKSVALFVIFKIFKNKFKEIIINFRKKI